jgi:hypothetical protein
MEDVVGQDFQIRAPAWHDNHQAGGLSTLPLAAIARFVGVPEGHGVFKHKNFEATLAELRRHALLGQQTIRVASKTIKAAV